jgi:uncharacterized lipoprotein YehR (DUF1307 family)
MDYLKNFFVMMIAGAMVLNMTACNDDDDSGPSGSIVGTWEPQESTTTYYDEDGNKMGEETQSYEDEDEVIEIKADNTYEVREDGEVSETGTYSISGSTITMVPDDENKSTDEFEFSVDGDTLTITLEDEFEDGSGNTIFVEYKLTLKRL